jgi:hypothetical protein
MKKHVRLLALVGALLLSGSAAWAADGFYVIGGGGGVGTKITSLPCIINDSGFYYLTRDLTYNGSSDAITINVDNVTLDLMGFSLIYTGGVGGYGIHMSGRANVEIRNGTVRGGFLYAVYEDSSAGKQHRVINVRAKSNSGGIWLVGSNHLVQGCSALKNGMTGIYIDSGMVNDSVASENNQGILVHGPGSLLGNVANNNTTNNFYIGNGVATSIMVDRNSAFGPPVLSANYFIPTGTSGVVGLDTGTKTNAGAP